MPGSPICDQFRAVQGRHWQGWAHAGVAAWRSSAACGLRIGFAWSRGSSAVMAGHKQVMLFDRVGQRFRVGPKVWVVAASAEQSLSGLGFAMLRKPYDARACERDDFSLRPCRSCAASFGGWRGFPGLAMELHTVRPPLRRPFKVAAFAKAVRPNYGPVHQVRPGARREAKTNQISERTLCGGRLAACISLTCTLCLSWHSTSWSRDPV